MCILDNAYMQWWLSTLCSRSVENDHAKDEVYKKNCSALKDLWKPGQAIFLQKCEHKCFVRCANVITFCSIPNHISCYYMDICIHKRHSSTSTLYVYLYHAKFSGVGVKSAVHSYEITARVYSSLKKNPSTLAWWWAHRATSAQGFFNWSHCLPFFIYSKSHILLLYRHLHIQRPL